MEIEYTLNEDDLITLARCQIQNSSSLKKNFEKRRWMFAGLFLVIAAGVYLAYQDLTIAAWFLALAVVAALFAPAILRWVSLRAIPKLIRERAKPASYEPRKLFLTPDGLIEELEGQKTLVAWSKVEQVMELEDHALIAIGGIFQVIIPREALEEGQYEPFIAELKKYIAARPEG